jgi:hypothetical protein
LPLLEWTIVRLVVSENDGRRHNSEMEPQGRTIDALFHTQGQSKTLCLEKTTLGVRVHVQTVGLNAETKKDRHRAAGKIFVLTFPLIGFSGLPTYRDLMFPTFVLAAELRADLKQLRRDIYSSSPRSAAEKIDSSKVHPVAAPPAGLSNPSNLMYNSGNARCGG